MSDIISAIIRDVAELPDRTSPEDWPEAMLVTSEELRWILTNTLEDRPTPRMSEDEMLVELGRLFNYIRDDSRQFTRWQMVGAMAHGLRLASQRFSAELEDLRELMAQIYLMKAESHFYTDSTMRQNETLCLSAYSIRRRIAEHYERFPLRRPEDAGPALICAPHDWYAWDANAQCPKCPASGIPTRSAETNEDLAPSPMGSPAPSGETP